MSQLGDCGENTGPENVVSQARNRKTARDSPRKTRRPQIMRETPRTINPKHFSRSKNNNVRSRIFQKSGNAEFENKNHTTTKNSIKKPRVPRIMRETPRTINLRHFSRTRNDSVRPRIFQGPEDAGPEGRNRKIAKDSPRKT